MGRTSDATLKMRGLAIKCLSDGAVKNFYNIYNYISENAPLVGLEPSYVTTQRVSAVMFHLTHKTNQCEMTSKRWYCMRRNTHNVRVFVEINKEKSPAERAREILKEASNQLEQIIVKTFSSQNTNDEKIHELFQYGMEIKELLRKAEIRADAWIEHE